MKYYFVIFILLFVYQIPSFSGWIDKGNCLELDRKIPGTNSIAFSEDGKSFYTFSVTDTCVRKRDISSGDVIDSFTVKMPAKCIMSTFSTDKNTFCYAYSFDSQPGETSHYIYFYAYNLENHQLIDKFSFKSYQFSNYGPSYSGLNTLDYDSKKGCFILGTSYSSSTSIAYDYSYVLEGKLIKGSDTNKIDISKISGNEIKNFQIDKINNRAILVLHSVKEDRPSKGPSHYLESSSIHLSDENLDSLKQVLLFKQGNSSGVPDTTLSKVFMKVERAVLNSNDSCIYFKNEKENILYTYDYYKKIFLKNYTLPTNLDINFNSFEDPRYLFIPYDNNLRIIHPQTKVTLSEFLFGANIAEYAYESDLHALLTLESNNTIQMRYPDANNAHDNFYTIDTLGYTNDEFTFYYTGLPNKAKYLWEFGDGFTSDLMNPKHRYGSADEYTVKLKLVDSSGTEKEIIKSKYIRIIDSLISDFSINYPDPKNPNFVMFSNKSRGNVIKTKWEFGDNATDISFNASHTYESEGFYSVKLIVWDEFSSDTLEKENIIQLFEVKPVFSNLSPQDSVVHRYSLDQYSPSSMSHTKYYVDISPKRDMYIRSNWGVSTQNFTYSASRFTLSDINKKIIKDTLFTPVNASAPITFDETGIHLTTYGNYYKYNFALDKILFNYNESQTNFYYLPDSILIGSKYNQTLKQLELKRYNWNNETIWTKKLPFTSSLISADKNSIVCLDLYSPLTKIARLDLNGNLIDSTSLPLSKNESRQMFVCKGSIYYFSSSNDSLFIYKIDNNNKITKRVLAKYYQNLSYFDNQNQSTVIRLSHDKYFAITGYSPIPGYIILDTDLDIVYHKRFPHVKDNFGQIQILSKNIIKLESGKIVNEDLVIFILTDTIPDGILEIPGNIFDKDNNNSKFSEIYIFPNPATDYISLYAQKFDPMSEIVIYDVFGELVLVAQTPLSEQRIDISALPPGIYFVRIGERIGKFMIVK